MHLFLSGLAQSIYLKSEKFIIMLSVVNEEMGEYMYTFFFYKYVKAVHANTAVATISTIWATIYNVINLPKL